MNNLENVLNKLDLDEQNIINTRRYIHENPEVSFEEKNTSSYIKNFYENLGMDAKSCDDGYGLIVDIDSGNPGKCIALRADFDALPVQEINDLPFKSKKDGVMHACGHDGHTAYLMYVAKALNEIKTQLNGKIRIIHQPAEEKMPGGALSMIKDGCLEGVDHVLGAHVMSNLKANKMFYHLGETQTGRANFKLTIQGLGGHASMPQISNDAILAGSYFVNEVQSIVSRRVNPSSMGVVTIGSFDGKGSANSINGLVTLEGDVRYFDNETKDLIQTNMENIVSGIEKAFSVKTDLNYQNNYPVLYNNPEFTKYAVEEIKKAGLPIEECDKQDPSEDFAYYAEKIPSTFLYVGCDVNDGKSHPHHSSEFQMDENCLIVVAKSIATVTLNYLK
ncbi:amidohydrolase [Lactobacillus sp. S2-2]|uniref:amidohydrolase n=1 Tax=Lactobacillus sp. S2-2 TaxID=2692917 RepID=UPI001F01381A|nr:amidohydrolase [Lactobacillus sp. S2-2]MCF6515611.1 amidohydrolase [Lactobacillus sp. S2-2]